MRTSTKIQFVCSGPYSALETGYPHSRVCKCVSRNGAVLISLLLVPPKRVISKAFMAPSKKRGKRYERCEIIMRGNLKSNMASIKQTMFYRCTILRVDLTASKLKCITTDFSPRNTRVNFASSRAFQRIMLLLSTEIWIWYLRRDVLIFNTYVLFKVLLLCECIVRMSQYVLVCLIYCKQLP